jgi:hypothetical protein
MVNKLKKRISSLWLKVLLSVIAISAIIGRMLWPEIKIDSITLGLFILALLPWFSEIIESAKLPGGWEIKFRDMQKAAEKVVEQVSQQATSEEKTLAPADTIEPAFLHIAERDPNLALAGLRIEIEKRLRLLAQNYQIPERRSLTLILRELQKREILTTSALSGLQELIYAGNEAAHGAKIEDGVADWAISYGPVILKTLNKIIEREIIKDDMIENP